VGLDSEAKKLGRHRGQSSSNNIQYQKDKKTLAKKHMEKERQKEAHCKKELAIFPSPAGMSLTKLSLGGKKLNYSRPGRV
jgi:hypothetical protein